MAESVNPLQAQGFNEGRHQPYSAEDIRFVTKGNVLYVHVMAQPENGEVVIKSLAEGNPLFEQAINEISILGVDAKPSYERNSEGLVVTLPAEMESSEISFVIKIDGI